MDKNPEDPDCKEAFLKTKSGKLNPLKMFHPVNYKAAFIGLLVVVLIVLIPVIIALSVSHNSTDVTETKCQKSAPCDDDWIWFLGKCYYFSNESNTWNNAQKFCVEHGASLALIDNQKEKDFILKYNGKDGHWIGLRRTEDNTGWVWANGTLYQETIIKIPRSQQPKTTDCVYLNSVVGIKSGALPSKWICSKM